MARSPVGGCEHAAPGTPSGGKLGERVSVAYVWWISFGRVGYPGSEDWCDAIHAGVFSDGRPSTVCAELPRPVTRSRAHYLGRLRRTLPSPLVSISSTTRTLLETFAEADMHTTAYNHSIRQVCWQMVAAIAWRPSAAWPALWHAGNHACGCCRGRGHRQALHRRAYSKGAGNARAPRRKGATTEGAIKCVFKGSTKRT